MRKSNLGRWLQKLILSGSIVLAALAGLAALGCERPLPEKGSAPERLYVERCGACHQPFNPHSMTASMWRLQVQAMEGKIAAAGEPALDAGQRLKILGYLERNSGQQ